jgi:hypothetical protein
MIPIESIRIVIWAAATGPFGSKIFIPTPPSAKVTQPCHSAVAAIRFTTHSSRPIDFTLPVPEEPGIEEEYRRPQCRQRYPAETRDLAVN